VDHPDNPASWSMAEAGYVAIEPETVISLVTTNKRGDPTGLLEKWSSDEWLYADADSLEPAEPAYDKKSE
jgi:hypothetical protein